MFQTQGGRGRETGENLLRWDQMGVDLANGTFRAFLNGPSFADCIIDVGGQGTEAERWVELGT